MGHGKGSQEEETTFFVGANKKSLLLSAGFLLSLYLVFFTSLGS